MNNKFNMKVFTKIQFIYLLFFIIILSLSKQLVNLHYDKPITNNAHKNFNTFLYELDLNINNRKLIRNNNKNCHKVSLGNINRHDLRWSFELLRVSIFKYNNKYLGNTIPNIYLFSFIFAIILFYIFYLINSIIVQNYKLKNIKSTFFTFFMFISFTGFFLIRPAGELRFLLFEFLFVNLSFYFALNKKFFPYLISVILCTLNRESGLLSGVLWLIINNLNFNSKKFLNFYLIDKFDLKSYLPIMCCLIALILFNYDITKCFMNIKFFIPADISGNTLFGLNKFELSLRTIDVLFVNYFLIFFILIYFYKKTLLQKKLAIFIVFYLIIFLIFTPSLTSTQLRLILVPFVIIYIIEFTSKKVVFKRLI